jgi:hypothetical protein
VVIGDLSFVQFTAGGFRAYSAGVEDYPVGNAPQGWQKPPETEGMRLWMEMGVAARFNEFPVQSR